MEDEGFDKWMRRCLQLASFGLGRVQPNPMVGAVIVHDKRIIGEGWHQQYGENHAEINALNAVKNQEQLKKSTLFVNLEPCSHYGKTPPCTEAIIRSGIPEVIIGNIDPNGKVNGKGINMLKNAGIKVIINVLEEECRELNKRFFTFHQQKRPYIILKWAQTTDGYMDIERREKGVIKPYWITNEELRAVVHKWRSEEDAVLIGYNTWLNDKPQLTVRSYPGKNPVRFIMQKKSDYSINDQNYNYLPDNLNDALTVMHEMKIQSVIVEGGRKTLDKFLEADMWDEARILVGNQQWNKGLKAPVLNRKADRELEINSNLVRYVRR